MAQEKDSDNIFLIIIDQLRADYAKYLPKCYKLLPHHAVCDTNSIPTSTEAMHANISTGKYPRNHGLISKTTKNGRTGLEQIVEKIRANELSSLASLGIKYGFNNYLIGGKPETVMVMGLDEECSLMIHKFYKKEEELEIDKEKKHFTIEGLEDSLVKDMTDFVTQKYNYKSNPEKWDEEVLDILNQIILKKEKNKSFFIVAFPSLDSVGHLYGPHSQEVIEHLNFLDTKIYSIIKNLKNTKFILVGDHGCRFTSQYLIEQDEKNPKSMAVYYNVDNKLEFQEQFILNSDLEQIQYDGGILRIWFKEGVNSLTKTDTSFLSKFGDIHYYHKEESEEKFKRFLDHSKHENLGDVVILSNFDTTFCKRSWINDAKVFNKISRRESLKKDELPLGEHGSPYSEDREVCFMSNFDFGIKTLKNTQIRDYIEILMKLT